MCIRTKGERGFSFENEVKGKTYNMSLSYNPEAGLNHLIIWSIMSATD